MEPAAQLDVRLFSASPHITPPADKGPIRYSPLTLTSNSTGFTYQPEGFVYGSDGIINGTMAIMLTDLDLFVTPFNTSMLNPHIVALGLYVAG